MAFVRAVAVGEIPAGTIREVDVAGKAIAIANVGGSSTPSTTPVCTGADRLGDGPLEGKIVTCPWHGWQYDVTTGKVVQNPTVGRGLLRGGGCEEGKFSWIWAEVSVSY